MKKSVLFFIFTALLFILLFGCSNPDSKEEKGTGYIEFIMPDYSPVNKAVFGMTGDEVQELQGSVRYDVIIETNGIIFKKYTLKKSEKAQIEVPSGRKFNVGVGTYLAKNRSSDDVLINSYFVSDIAQNISAPMGDTVYIPLVLNYNKPSLMTYYYATTNGQYLGMSDITGSVIYNGATATNLYNSPMFISKNLYNNDPDGVYYSENKSVQFFMNANLDLNNTGMLFPTHTTLTSYEYWYPDNIEKNIKVVSNGLADFDSPALSVIFRCINNDLPLAVNANTADAMSYIPASDRGISIYQHNGGTMIAIFKIILHKDGMIMTRVLPKTAIFSFANTDFSSYSSIHPNLPFVLEIKGDEDTGNYQNFFLTKIGAYYIDNITLEHFASGHLIAEYRSAMQRLKRKIVIKDAYDPRLNQIINDIEILGNNIYLSTAQGIYKIKKSSSAWTDFKNSSPDEERIFPDDKIEKIISFSGKKAMALFSDNEGILMIATNKSVYFYNTANNAFREYTLWDGLPFIPAKKPPYEPDFNAIDYQRGGMSPVRNILWDAQYQKYWIATMHGLVSINKNEVF